MLHCLSLHIIMRGSPIHLFIGFCNTGSIGQEIDILGLVFRVDPKVQFEETIYKQI